MIKIVTVLGARPQFIKAAALSRALLRQGGFEEVIVHTGQHFDANMSDVFFNELNIPKPAYNLNIHGLSHGAMTGQMLSGVEEILLKEKPDYVMVYGDTNSTLAGALAAKKLGVKVIHIEAGLRSFNMAMPEEINRILTDRISDLLCCPTDAAMQNLKHEGFDTFALSYLKTGDVMQDAALYYADMITQDTTVSQMGLEDGKFILCTLHRAENTDDPKRMGSIMQALRAINKEMKVVIPLHPRTKAKLSATDLDGITCIAPQGYLNMIALLKWCKLVMTDSGGLQKEAYFFQKYCITLRTETEWVELVEGGYNLVAGFESGNVIEAFNRLKDLTWNGEVGLYGGGKASAAICEAIKSHYNGLPR